VEIDWLQLWQELIRANPHIPDSEPIKRYKAHAHRGQRRPDPLLDFILQSTDSNDTVLDIGAGNGRWTVPLARIAKAVTAVEPDRDMLAVLRENIKGVPGKVKIIPSFWEEAQVETHDIAVSAHAVYSCPDLASFVRKMEKHARKQVFLAIRLPPADGIIGELSKAIHGHLYDSANAIIAYNAFYTMGIYPNVLMEKEICHWTNSTFEEAFIRAKRHLQIKVSDTYDGFIRDTLRKRLVFSNNCYIWPDGMRSALLWWNPAS